MPYANVSEVPDSVPADKKRQWMHVWNSAYERAIKDGKSPKAAEQSAFAQANSVAGPNSGKKAMTGEFKKFIPFIKVDESKRQVWGVVTAEVPDKDEEVCDYAKTKPYYKAVIDEMGKATQGQNFFPLREMHQLSAAGKCVGFEFRDDEKEIFMGFEVVDDEAWKKVQKRVYTGFSQGGRIVGDLTPDPVFKGCMRYTADPSECSLVDNPCLGLAHFALIKADGSVEICKLRTAEPTHEEKVIPTKMIGGKTLDANDFAYVGNPEKTETWKLEIYDAAHVRSAVASFDKAEIPESEKAKVYARIITAGNKCGVDVSDEERKLYRINDYVRKAARIWVNSKSRKSVEKAIYNLDTDLGKLKKGMRDVSPLAKFIDDFSYFLFMSCTDSDWEDNSESMIPESLTKSIDNLISSLLEVVSKDDNGIAESKTASTTAV